MKIWMYINHPSKLTVIHENPGCPHVLNRKETRFLGSDHLRRDGGWLAFNTLLEAKEYRLAKLERYKVKRHCLMASRSHVNHDAKTRVYLHNDLSVNPINSVTDHYQKHVGLPTRRASIKQLPKWLQWFNYFILVVLAIIAVMIIIVGRLS